MEQTETPSGPGRTLLHIVIAIAVIGGFAFCGTVAVMARSEAASARDEVAVLQRQQASETLLARQVADLQATTSKLTSGGDLAGQLNLIGEGENMLDVEFAMLKTEADATQRLAGAANFLASDAHIIAEQAQTVATDAQDCARALANGQTSSFC
jgi:hypothetical protein